MVAGIALFACAPVGQETSPRVGLAPEPCGVRDEAVEVGRLDADLINEASGVEVSPAFPDRLYHINDSGDTGRFFITDRDGGNPQVVRVEGFDPVDAEDLSLGECPAGGECLFIADFGNNNRDREIVELIVVEEPAEPVPSVAPLRRVRLRYEEGPQDAESLAVHPDGDLYIVTKSADYANLRVNPSNVYRIPREAWRNSGDEVLVPELVAVWDLPSISSDPFSGSLPTAADISEDGDFLLILTYNNAFEFSIEAWDRLGSTGEMVAGVDYREIEIETLEQQESIAYLPGSRGFLYDTEAGAGGRSPRIMEVRCLN